MALDPSTGHQREPPIQGPGELLADHRARIALELHQELERKQRELLEQVSARTAPAERIRIWDAATRVDAASRLESDTARYAGSCNRSSASAGARVTAAAFDGCHDRHHARRAGHGLIARIAHEPRLPGATSRDHFVQLTKRRGRRPARRRAPCSDSAAISGSRFFQLWNEFWKCGRERPA